MYLTATANRGDNELHISANVLNLWKVNDEIVVAPTGYSPWQAETFKITAIDSAGTKLTLNTTLVYKHLGELDIFFTPFTFFTPLLPFIPFSLRICDV